MEFNEICSLVADTPYISHRNALSLYTLIVEERLEHCLELGFAHGAASCYMAAALEELGKGRVTAVDIEAAKSWQKPSIEELLSKTGLTQFVDIQREKTGYNWFLQKQIAMQSNNRRMQCMPKYDLCIIDGPKNWTIDSSAFFLVDKLLKPNGWIIFDDYEWTYAESNKVRNATDGITHRELSQEELDTPHIKQVFDLLVMQHPGYHNFKIERERGWVWAQKTGKYTLPLARRLRNAMRLKGARLRMN